MNLFIRLLTVFLLSFKTNRLLQLHCRQISRQQQPDGRHEKVKKQGESFTIGLPQKRAKRNRIGNMKPGKPRLLIIEDEEAILQGLTDVFVYNGYEVETATEGELGLEKALSGEFHLILLDIMLPGLDGFSICDRIRERDRHLPIIMLTAKTSEDDIIKGLKLGADDYVPKPFSVRQLVARVEAVLRRSGRLHRDMNALQLGDLLIHPETLIGTSQGKEIPFTRRELEILLYLSAQSSRPVSRQELLKEVWGYAHVDYIETRTVDIHMAKLRRKIEKDPRQPQMLVTVRGEGYQLRGCE
jgi:two-component system response regulator RegX3